MSVTYYMALAFAITDGAIVPRDARDCHHELAAVLMAETLSRTAPNVGAVAFRRTGDPFSGQFGDPEILKSFGEVPSNLDDF